MGIVNFVCWVVVVALSSAWIITLSEKWGWREWLQVHADCVVFGPDSDRDFFNRLFTCNFCCAFHIAVIISLTLLVLTGQWSMLAVPFCSTTITKHLI